CDHERDREPKRDQHYERLHHPFRRMKGRQHGRTNLDHKPADDGVRNRNLVNVAPLQLGKEVIDLHGSLSGFDHAVANASVSDWVSLGAAARNLASSVTSRGPTG